MGSWYYDILLGVILLALVLWFTATRIEFKFSVVAALAALARLWAWFLFFVALLAVMLFVGNVLGLLLWLATVVIAMMINNRYRETERRMLLWALGMAAEKGIPLPDAARAFADERSDLVGRRARKLAAALEQGMPLDAAIELSGTALSTSALVAVRTGCETGRLGNRLQEVTGAVSAAEYSARGAGSQIIYLMLFGCVMLGLDGYLQYRVIPEYIKIFEGFNLRLPWTTIAMVHANRLLVSPLMLFVYLVGAVVLMYVLAKYIGLIVWEPPLVRAFTRRLDQAIVLRSLAQAVEQNQTMPAAVALLASCYPKAYIRARLDQAFERLSEGVDWCDSLRGAGLVGKAEAAVLKSAERTGNLRWALDEMAERQVRRYLQHVAAAFAIIFPALLLAVGGVAFFLSVSMFLPLVDLIKSLT